MASKVVILIMCLIWAEVNGTTTVMESSASNTMSSLEQCSMSYYGMGMSPDSMWMSSDSMWMSSDSMSMSLDSMSMSFDFMSMSSNYHHDPSETQYMTDSEGHTICYFPPMTSSSEPPPMSSSSDMSPPPPMPSSSAMPPPPPMSSSSDMPPPPSMSSYSDMPPPPSMSSSSAMSQPPPMSPSSAMSQPPPMSSSMPPPPMSSSSGMPPPMSSSMPPPPMSSSSVMPPPMSSSMPPPPMSSSSDMPPPMSSSMSPPPPTGVQSSMTSSESQTSSTTPAMAMSSSMHVSEPYVPLSFTSSSSSSYPPPSLPPMSGSYPPESQTFMSGSFLPPSQPQMSGLYPPPSQSFMSESYPLPSQLPMSGSYPPQSQPLMSGSYPPPSQPLMSGSYPPPSQPLMSGSYPPPSQPLISGSYPPPSQPLMSGSYPPPSQPLMSGSYPPPSQPFMSESYPPPSQPSMSGSYQPPSQPPMSESYPPPSQSLMSGSYPPPGQPPMSHVSPSNVMMSASFLPPPASSSGSRSEFLTSLPSLSTEFMDASMTMHVSVEYSSSAPSVQPTPSSSMEMSSSAAVPSCSGTVDCAGVCDGPNSLDSDCNVCYGPQGNYSQVSDFKDCNNSCSGSATINKCGFCTGGNTGKTTTEGVDTCNGMCINDPKYINPVDCNSDCNGTAFIDASCSGVCMGGNTGILTNHSRDCSNICNGTNEIDSCGFCTAPFNGAGGSLYKDCSDTCMTPATLKDGASENKCGNCVGGSTGKVLTFGIDVCGICSGNGTTCLDCNGDPNGGKVNDACNICGGDGTSCDVVVSISPEYAPSVTESTIDLLGAGFSTSSTRTCYIKKGSDANIALTVASVVSPQKQTVTIPNNVAAGTYKIDCISGSDMSVATIDLIVYDSTGVSLSSISPTTFIKVATTDTQVLTLTGTGFIQNSTYCIIVTGGATESVIEATWTDATSAACTINHPAISQAMQVYLSLNGRYKHLPSKVVTAQAAAPTASATFEGDNGAEITMTFSDAVDTSSFSDCSNIFNTASVTALGPNVQCTPVSGTKLLIRGTSLTLSSSLTPKSGVIKQAGEPEALPLNSAVSVSTPANKATPVVSIVGPNELGSCDNEISLRAVTSSGGVGRDIAYSWSVSPDTPTISSNSSQTTDVTGLNPGTYTFTMGVTNFFSVSGSVSKTVVKKSVNLPNLFVSSTGGDTVFVSESFDLIANAQLIKGCADDTLTFSWSFSGGITADNIQKIRSRYTVAANSLPAGQTITATVTVALQSKPGDTIEGNAIFTTAYAPLNARIKGASTRTIGVDGGSLSLDASSSVDPSNLGDMTYSWQCQQIENNVASGCLSSDGNVFPSSTTAIFTFNANKLLPAKQYRFTVTTQSGSRTSQASALVNSVAGNPPKVEMSEIKDGGYVEKSDTVKLDALITLPSAGSSIVSIVWTSVQDSGQGFIDLTNPSNLAIEAKQIDLGNNKVFGIMSIKGGILEKGERYTIQSTITDNSNNVIIGSVDINVYTGVKSCQLEPISTYTAMAQVDVAVKHCMTDTQGGTLSYKLFIQTDNNGGRLALTDNLVTNTLSIPYGPNGYIGSTNVFIVLVCAKMGGCMELTSDPVTVASISPAQLEAAKTNVLASIEDLKKTGDPLKGAVILGVFVDSTSSASSRRKRSVTTDSIHTALLDLIALSLTGATKTQDRITTIMGVLCTLNVASVSDVDLGTVIGNFNETVSFMDENRVAVPKEHVECFLVFNKKVKTRGLDADFILPKISNSIAKGFSYGDVEVFSIANEYDMKHSEEIPSSAYTTGASTNPVQVDFGGTLASQYGSWACSSGTCSGVVIKSQHYATTLDPFSTVAKDISERASDVLSLDLLDPHNGVAITGITNLATPITLKFPVTKPIAGATYKCKYWDVSTSTWKDDGVTTSTQTASQVDCTSDHLTSFAVFKGDTTSDGDDSADDNLAAIIGGTIAGIIVLAFIVIVIVVIIKKKKDNTKIHSRENLREEEMVGS